jgi:ribonuclease E
MAKRMLIDATHPEETRVVVLNGNRLEEFDFESSTKKQVKGNIYLAKVTRVEPSLQASFIDYGNHRHGFLAFSEIHPDYFNIPVGDRESSESEIVAEEPDARDTGLEPADGAGVSLAAALPEQVQVPAVPESPDEEIAEAEPVESPSPVAGEFQTSPVSLEEKQPSHEEPRRWEPVPDEPVFAETVSAEALVRPLGESAPSNPEADGAPPHVEPAPAPPAIAAYIAEDILVSTVEPVVVEPEFEPETREPEPAGFANGEEAPGAEQDIASDGAEPVETLGGDEFEEAEHQRSRTIRHYKIQEVIKRRQIMLVQVTKEERGNKGAALTSYLSLAGRYCVLMPNTARGGGVSRKITSLVDRRRLKDILEDLDIPEGMGVIVRTAGAERSKAEIKRDYEYLLRLWNEIRDLTLRSTAPALIYEEGNLIKRSIRDLYTRDIDEVLVEGEEGYRTAKAFMKMLMPSHAKRVQPYRDPQIGLFHRFQVESQIDAIHSPIVQLRSGGYVVINQTEALVAIDVNSGRSTRERNIEETAVRTNLEAAEEIARQLRLRDLAGLIVIDFIDMEEHRNQGAVERRLKEALKNDRARIQVGRISAFGLLEMSRQRLRPSLVETSTQPCPHCGGTGSIRSTESTALYVLRSIEEEGMRRRSAEIAVHVPTTVALYILNQKRDSLVQLESRYGIRVMIARDDVLIPPAFRLERLRAYTPSETAVLPMAPLTQAPPPPDDEEEEDEVEIEVEAEEPLEGAEAEQESSEEHSRSRRRRRRRRRHEEEPVARPAAAGEEAIADSEDDSESAAPDSRADGEDREEDEEADSDRRRRRRGRRGGRHRGRRDVSTEPDFEGPRPASDTVEILPVPLPEESEPALVEARMEWPVEVSAVAIEKASLPALAGDPPPRSGYATMGAGGEDEPPASLVIETARIDAAHAPPTGETPAAEEREVVTPPTAESEEGLPYVSETERVLEIASATSEASPEPPPHPVETVTEKPANPRRGWWQRLMQS